MFLETATTGTEDATQAAAQATEKVDTFFAFDFGDSVPANVQYLLNKCIEVVVVIVVLLLLWKLVDLITKGIKKKMLKKGRDKTATHVIYYLSNRFTKFILLCIAIGVLGIDTSSIVGLLTAAGLGIGLAVQGALSNLAGGILILLIRPFRVDDFIECQGVMGTVEDIHIFYTYLATPDNKVVMVPNGALINGTITNYSVKDIRRVDFSFCIDYESNFLEAQNVIQTVCKAHASVLKNPEPTVRLGKLDNSSVNITTRVWVKNAEYWPVYFDLLEQVYAALNEANIKIPYNQLEISYRQGLEAQEKEGK